MKNSLNVSGFMIMNLFNSFPTTKVAIIAVVGVIVILIIIFTLKPNGECVRVDILQQKIEVSCDNSNDGQKLVATNGPIPTINTEPSKPTSAFNLVGSWNMMGQVHDTISQLNYPIQGNIQFASNGYFKQTITQIGFQPVNKPFEGSYELEGNTLSLHFNGQTETQTINVIDMDSFSAYDPLNLYYISKRIVY